jgi:hypothetical protein
MQGTSSCRPAYLGFTSLGAQVRGRDPPLYEGKHTIDQ